MKKKILTLILPAVAMITAACGETKPCDHKDDNKDHLCDLCGEKISDHIDENPKDHKCDICEQSMGEHADKNNDHNCDYCGEKMSEHTAPNAEGKCDICGEVIANPVVNSVQFSESSVSIEKGKFYKLFVIVDAKYGASSEVEFSSEDESIAKVDAEGKVTAIEAGNTKVWAVSKFDNTKKAFASIRVTDPEIHHDPIIDSVTVSPKSGSIDKGKTIELTATVSGQYDYSREVSWESSDKSIATVEDGRVYGVKAGTVTIKAISVQDPTKFDTATITVKDVTPENKELEKFNELVAAIKTGHNYEIDLSSEVETYEEDENYYDHIVNYDDKAMSYNDASGAFSKTGYIYQKDQGYVYFNKSGSTIYPSTFFCTNPNKGLSEIIAVIGEGMFSGDYEQDATDKTKFVTEDERSIAVGCNFTGFAFYIQSGQLTSDTSMSAFVDLEKETITIKMNYWLHFFDVEEQHLQGVLTMVFHNIGGAEDSAISSYIENPTRTYSAPTEWGSSEKYLFTQLNSGYNPVFPEGLSYAYDFNSDYIDGFQYAIAYDDNSGDLRESYGAQLIADGYSKVDINNYRKVVVNGMDTITYKVLMSYAEPSVAFPNGNMKIGYRAIKDTGVFNDVASFNNYMKSKKYDELVPLLPEDSNVTKISNVKDQTDNHSESYCLYMNSTDEFKVYIADYSKAQIFYNMYAEALIAKGYSDIDTQWGMYNYGLEWSTSSSHVSVDFAAEANYLGYIGIRYVVTKADEESLRPAPEAVLDHIEVSEMSTSYEVGESFSFDGVCTAFYSDESFKVVEPTYVSKPDMTTTGQKTIIVKYSDHDVEKQTSYTINVSEAAAKLASLEISGFYDTQFVKDGTFNHSGMCVTAHYDDTSTKIVSSSASFDYDLSEAGIKSVTVSCTEDGKTVSTSYNILVSEGSLKWPGLSMATNEDVSLEGFYNLDFDTITNFNYNNSQSFIVAINTIAEIENMYLDEDPNASIVLDYEYGSYKEYIVTPTKTLDVSSYTLVVQTKALTKYNLSVDSSIENGSLDLKGIAKAAPGAEVDIYYEADEGYEIESISAVDHPEIEISWYDYGGFYWFVMPEHDVELTATFKEIPQTHKLSFAQDLENGRVTTSKGITEVKAGETAYFQAIPNAGYEVESVFVVGDDSIVPVWDKDNVYKFTMPNKDVTLCATFKAIPKTLTGIAISGQKNEFTVGDPFSVGDLVVTASYANGEKATVTGYSVDSSKVDMSTAGDYKVTISYTEDGVTKSQEYVISVKGSDVTSTIYSGSMKVTTYDYSYTLTINSDGTGVYELTRTPNGGTASTYKQYFTWTDAGDGKINIVQDSSKTSTLCKNDKFNLWYDSSFDVPGSFKNTITTSSNTASFTSHAYNDERTSATRELTLSLVA